MNSYVHLIVHVTEQHEKDLLVARLSQLEFEGFEEKDTELHAFIAKQNFKDKPVKRLLEDSRLQYATSILCSQNWNALWESNFDPVTIDDFCTVRADFHPENRFVEHEIIITPKMSFGTGHHATTYLMIQEMRELNFAHKKVADFGTGTGILSILAERLGSNGVWAIDCDDWSIENAKENIEKNNCQHIHVQKANVFSTIEKFDIILANINKNVIIDNLGGLVFGLKPGGKMLLSGLLKDDEYDILMACQGHNLLRVKTVERDKWICLLLEH
jgi:ribosomal protein L11 methyltransferase